MGRIASSLIAIAFAIGPLKVVCSALEAFDVQLELTDASLVLVPVHINGAGPEWFALDTAATTTMLDVRLANRLALMPSRIQRYATSAGEFSAATGTVAELRIGEMRTAALEVSWVSLDAIRRHDQRIVGILGQDVLAGITMTLDFSRRALRLGSESCADGDVAIEVQRADGRPMLAAQVIAPGLSPDARLVIDSAADALILFDNEARADADALLRTHVSEMRGTAIRKARVAIGNIALTRDAFLLSSSLERIENGLLPASWFSRVCVDGPGGRAVLTR